MRYTMFYRWQLLRQAVSYNVFRWKVSYFILGQYSSFLGQKHYLLRRGYCLCSPSGFPALHPPPPAVLLLITGCFPRALPPLFHLYSPRTCSGANSNHVAVRSNVVSAAAPLRSPSAAWFSSISTSWQTSSPPAATSSDLRIPSEKRVPRASISATLFFVTGIIGPFLYSLKLCRLSHLHLLQHVTSRWRGLVRRQRCHVRYYPHRCPHPFSDVPPSLVHSRSCSSIACIIR